MPSFEENPKTVWTIGVNLKDMDNLNKGFCQIMSNPFQA